jgi:HEAT repeat protein
VGEAEVSIVSNTAQDLVQQMTAAEGWPEPQVLEDILKQRETAVAPLLDVVGREISEESDVDVLCHACLLLGNIGATSAIPALVKLFYRYDSDMLEDVAQALVMLGTDAVEPALAAVRDGSLPWYPRAMAANAAIEAARPDPALQEHVTTVLRDLLAGYVARAEDLEDDEISTATSSIG